MRAARKKRRVLFALLAVYTVGTIVARRRGYAIGSNCVVRCREGHLFTTIWIPGVSAKSIRLGWWRVQWCPVGQHWSIISPVREADLTDDEKQVAHQNRDIRIP